MTKQLLTVLVDQDGVLANFDARAHEVCAENGWVLDIDHPFKQIHRYLTDHVPHKHHRNQLRKHIDFTPYFADLPLIEGAQEGIAELMRKADVWICSKPLLNNETCASDKGAWVNRHFPKLKDRLILAPDKSLIKGDILLDDAPKIKWLDRAEWQPVVYTQSYNTHTDSPLYHLPHWDWSQPVDDLLSYAKEHA